MAVKIKPYTTMYDYGECYICGARIQERRVKQDFWIKGKLIIIENVPAGVCPQCGERVLKADVGQRLAALVEDSKQRRKTRTISVPVLRFPKGVG